MLKPKLSSLPIVTVNARLVRYDSAEKLLPRCGYPNFPLESLAYLVNAANTAQITSLALALAASVSKSRSSNSLTRRIASS